MQRAAPAQQRTAAPQGEDPVPTYNKFIRGTLGKGESANYVDQLQGLAALKSYDEKQGDLVLKLLARLLQYGHLNIAGVQLALQVLQVDLGRDDKALMRVVQYLVLLGLGDGSAGTPLPVPPQAGGTLLAKAVDRLGLESLVAAWNDLGKESAVFTRKQAALRALSAVTRASLSSRPEDGTYVAGLYETLRGLLDKMDQLRAQRRGLAHILSQAQGNKKKNIIADYRQRAEMWGLMRAAFSAARLALPRTGLYKIAQRSLSALGSSDPVCARHALALASLVARDPAGAGSFIAAVEPLLARNVEAARRTGALHLGILPGKRPAGGDGGDGGDSENHLNLRDTWARVYLARACAAVIQSGHIAGDVAGRGAVFWQALLLLAVADPSERVSLEAIRAMFGSPYPRATTAAALRQPGAGARLAGAGASPAEVEADSSQSKIFGASWHLVMTQALEQPPVQDEAQQQAPGAAGAGAAAATPPGKLGSAAAAAAAAAAASSPPVGGPGVRAEDTCLFGRVARRLMRCLQSRSHSLVCGAARCVAVLAEARAWFHALSGGHGHEAEPEVARRWMRSLHGFLLLLAADDSVSGCERAAALEALVWGQGLDQPPTLSPGLMLKAASHGGFTAPPIVRYTFADPWPDCLVAEVLSVLGRRLRCTVGLPPELVLELAGGLTAGSPTGTPREALTALWDMAPGPVAVRAALQLLASPLPPLCQPTSTAAVEVKALACQAEAAFGALKATAACWLGEHINSIAGEYAWKQWEAKLGPKAGGLDAAAGSLRSAGPSDAIGGSEAAAALAAAPSYRGAPSPIGTADGAPAGSPAAGGEDAVARLAVAGVTHNPLLALSVAHLHRAMLTGSHPVRVACAQALAKVAVRSGEPYRIQCYSLLTAAAGAMGGAPSAGAAGVDPLGLAPVVAPALEVLDAMYAGELVLERHVAQHGTRARLWPGPALEALRRRHEWLLGAIACCVCAVPRELFLPLGPRSRRLLFPDEKEEAEEEARAVAAAAPQSQGQNDEYGQPYEQQYDEYGQPYQYDYSTAEQYDYGDYYNSQQDQQGQQQDPYGQEEDPLARYDFSGQKAAAAVELQWGGDQAGAYDMDASTDALAVAEARLGTALYTFTAETEGEVSVSAGDSVRVLHDLGEWFQVVAPSGQAGLVPASYVQLLDEQAHAGGEARGQRASQLAGASSSALGGGMLSNQPSFAGRAQSIAGPAGLQTTYSYGGGNQGQQGTPGGASTDYYAYQYENPEYDANNGNDAYGSYYGDYAQYGGDQYGGGTYSNSAYGGMYGEEAAAPDAGDRGGKKGGFGGFDDFGTVLAEVKTAAAAARQQQQEQRQQATTLLDPTASSTSTAPPADAGPEQPAAALPYSDATDAWSAPVAPQEAAAADAGGGGRASVVYDFTAEMDGELTVGAGEELELLGGEVDGWYTARVVSDGRQGLIPASYVQL